MNKNDGDSGVGESLVDNDDGERVDNSNDDLLTTLQRLEEKINGMQTSLERQADDLKAHVELCGMNSRTPESGKKIRSTRNAKPDYSRSRKRKSLSALGENDSDLDNDDFLLENQWRKILKELFHYDKFPSEVDVVSFVVRELKSIRGITDLSQDLKRNINKLTPTLMKTMNQKRAQNAHTIREEFVATFMDNYAGKAPQLAEVSSNANFSLAVRELGEWWSERENVVKLMTKAYGGSLPVQVDNDVSVSILITM